MTTLSLLLIACTNFSEFSVKIQNRNNKKIEYDSTYICIEYAITYICIEYAITYICIEYASTYICIEYAITYICIEYASTYICIEYASTYIRSSNRLRDICLANELNSILSTDQKRKIALAKEKGSSSWLTVLPIEKHGFFLNKGEFRDAIHLRYGWDIRNVPQSCVCGSSFSVDHALTCKRGGFPIIRHNEIRDLTAKLLSEVCHSVATEPPLQPLSGESFSYRSAIVGAEARLDIKARGFWNLAQDAYFDVRVFHPNAPCYRSRDLASVCKQHESAKNREYNQRIQNVMHGVFTPLVFTTTGSMGREGTTFYKHLADMLSHKQEKPYSVVMGWLRCRLSFAILRSSIMCLRGTRSSFGHPVNEVNLTLARAEGQVPSENYH